LENNLPGQGEAFMDPGDEMWLGRRNNHCRLTFDKKWSKKYFFKAKPRISGLVENVVTCHQWLYIVYLGIK